MKGYIRRLIAVIAALAVLFAGSTIILNTNDEGDGSCPYRVEAKRISDKIEKNESYSLDDYRYITDVVKISENIETGNSDYMIKKINGNIYRFDYTYHSEGKNILFVFFLCFGVIGLFVICLMIYIYFRIILPFERMSEYPTELAKGNLIKPLKEQKNGYFGKFLWGLDLLRERLEKQKAEELELKKQNNTMVLSLSHDIKTPLGVIELYAKALERGLYKDEEKKKEISVNIHAKCEEIRRYVDDIAKTESEEFLSLDVNNGEFYLSELIGTVKSFYTEKLSLLKTEFIIDDYNDCILCGDNERAVEVIQNIMENAVKYGNGKRIAVSFSKEEDCQLIHISNSGCTLSDSELPHIFDSYWRGSNTGSQSGSGLGLYICRTLMRKMGGDIFARIKDGNMIVTAVFSQV